MGRKKAKFHIEVEYEDTLKLSTDNMKIITCESEGDFKGITLAMTTGLAFAASASSDNKEIFQKKLRLIRGVGSALHNCILVLKNEGALSDEDISPTTVESISTEIKRCVDFISLGISRVLRISDSEINEFNKEYSEESLNNNNNGEFKQRGLESNDFSDLL